MIELKKTFKKGSRTFTQLHKDDEIVIYGVTDNAIDGVYSYFEVFRPMERKPDKFHDDCYEKYPCDEDFGKWAWCCSNYNCLVKAIKKHWGDDYEIPSI